MFRAFRLLGLSSAVVLLLAAPPAWADSHVPIEGESTADPEALLKERLDKLQAWSRAQNLAREVLDKVKGQDPEDLRKLLPQFEKTFGKVDFKELQKGSLNDPKVRAFIEEIVKQKTLDQIPLDPEQKDYLRKALEVLDDSDHLAGLPPLPLSPITIESGDKSPPRLTVPTPGGEPGSGPNRTGPRTNGAGPSGPRPSPPAPAEPNPGFSGWLLRMSRQMQARGTPVLKDSPALHRAIQELGRYNTRRFIEGKVPGKLQAEVARATQYLRSQPMWQRERWAWLNQVRLPGMSPRDLPNFNAPRLGAAPPISVPHVHLGRPSPGEGVGFLWVLVLVIMGLAAWKVLARPEAAAEGEGAEWKLGPWPVRPAAVRSGADLILAFEHLSLLRLGPDALSWNHRHLAAALEAGQPAEAEERRQAVRHLAGLYEQARYAPGAGALPEDELAAARRELSLLAEGPAT